ncbi:penicillin acylase family protein [Cupriavidus basilensis]|uniref:Penicillin acylase family protein n=1 Tax=Cupriavidus basilensis TaxID=68895 RepID=A0ABT6AQG2_9BURK|nr:penicillin acylase family protein [Cupriavidus basilensis]MDF3834812.1 penicillin acylase family protein [Cupriavidus basilensis]
MKPVPAGFAFLCRAALAGWLCVLLTGCGDEEAASPDSVRYSAQIRRTSYGVPHVTADDEAGLGFGIGYAQAQDGICVLADQFLTVAGERSRHLEANALVEQGGRLDNRASDFFYTQLNHAAVLDEAWRAQPPELRSRFLGFAAGYNRYLEKTGRQALPRACRNAAWVRDINERDLMRLMRYYASLNGVVAFAPWLVAAQPPGAGVAPVRAPARRARVALAQAAAATGASTYRTGSNGVALGRDATRNGQGMLLGNPHFPWHGITRMMQLHLTLPGRIDVMGATLPGMPVIGIGFTREFAWTHTTASSSHETLFELDLDPDDPTRYRVDGVSRPMQRQVVTIDVRQSDGSIGQESHTFYLSEFGMVLALPESVPGHGWTRTKAYALRDANTENHRMVAQWHAMNRARSLAQLRESVERVLGNPWNNTIAVDSGGTALFMALTPVPNVSAAQLARCGRGSVAGRFVLRGTPACQWADQPGTPQRGIFAAAGLPVIQRMDYVQNSNDSAWLTQPAAPLTGYSPLVSQSDYPQGGRTRIGIQQLEARLAGTDGLPGRGMTLPQLEAIALSNRVYFAEQVMDDLLKLCRATPAASTRDGVPVRLGEACERLAAWDRTAGLGSNIGYLYFEKFFAAIGEEPSVWAVPFDARDPVGTPRGLRLNDAAAAGLLRRALADAVHAVNGSGVRPDITWGELQVVRRGTRKIPIHGGSDALGVYNMMESREQPDGTREVMHGTSYLQAVSFGPAGPHAEAFLAYSQSSDPDSPHAADQTERFSRKRWIALPFTEAEIRADPGFSERRIWQ